MSSELTEEQLRISHENLLVFVHAAIGARAGREDDEHPLPPGPWDPVIRVALERLNVFGHPVPWRVVIPGLPWESIQSVFGPHPEPWKVVLASILARHPEVSDALGGHGLGDAVALNPQPLPPRFAFLISVAQTFIGRAEFLQETADIRTKEGEHQGTINVGGYVSRFVDELCGNEFRLKYPFPGPPPHWFTEELAGIDLVVIATQFEQSAKESYSPNLRQSLSDGSVKFVQAGLSKLQDGHKGTAYTAKGG